MEMEKAREALMVGEEASELVSRLDVRPHRAGRDASFYEGLALRGIRVDHIQPGLLTCSFKVPPRLTDSSGNLSPGAIANLVDEVGGAVMHADGHHMKVSVDMSISYMSTAKVENLDHRTASRKTINYFQILYTRDCRSAWSKFSSLTTKRLL